MEPKARPKAPSVSVPSPQQALVRLLNSTRDFAAAVGFIKRAQQYDQSTIEHVALFLGALISYSRPFKDRDGAAVGETLSQSPIFLAVATDLGADLELHARIVGLSLRAMACSEPLSEPLQRAASFCNSKIHSFSFPDRSGVTLARQLNLVAFERISNLMRLACVFTLSDIGDPQRRHKTVNCRD
jgi:hypothetical protein